MKNFDFKLVSSLEKVFPKTRPAPMKTPKLSGLKGEKVSFQIAYTITNAGGCAPEDSFTLHIDSKIKDHIKVRKVGLVPSLLPAYENYDDNYITTNPGVLPDLLTYLKDGQAIFPPVAQWRALWVDVDLTDDLTQEDYQINLTTKDKAGKVLWEENLAIEVIKAELPDQELIHTEWFHGDCLADYYKVDVFSDEHWKILNNFIKTAADNGMNMLLTPVFTPPLDTAVGGERTTIQLVDMALDNGKYTFNFDKLQKWIEICKNHGIKYLEMAHLFTQWGAEFTPKIMVTVDGEYKRLFGWDVEATSLEYKKFIDAFLPELLSYLNSQGFNEKNTYFHVSDEPHIQHVETYRAAKNVVSEHLKGYTIIDALSDYEFYKEGLIEKPIPANNYIQPFIDENVENLWVYYCCAQNIDVANRFMAMPSARNRIIGVQMYLENIEGFLHWGYNFYSSRNSVEHINPYADTDSSGAFPSGDPFLVYPGKDGKPEESIRLMVFSQALYDLRALKFLERLTSREHVENLIYKDVDYKITFEKYPRSIKYIETLRSLVNQEIKNNL